ARAAPPPRPDVPGARGGSERGRDPRPGARDGSRTADRPRPDNRGLMLRTALRRSPTPDAPGPGPMPEALLRALDLSIGRRVEGLLAGDYRSALLGQGSELALIRPYVPGDDVRRIDWNVTARTNEPHVRVDLAERVLVTWLVLDTSASMELGTAERRKAARAQGGERAA